jgi:hypothetical protein
MIEETAIVTRIDNGQVWIKSLQANLMRHGNFGQTVAEAGVCGGLRVEIADWRSSEGVD